MSLLAGLAVAQGPAYGVDYAITNVADTNGPYSTIRAEATIINDGTVAFSATRDAGGQGIFAHKAGLTTTLMDTSGQFNSVSSPSFNNAGEMAFGAGIDTALGGGRGIYKLSGGGVTTTIAHQSGAMDLFGSPGIDGSGAVTFHATLDAGGQGIFRGNGAGVTTIVDSSGPFSTFGIGAGARVSVNAGGTVVFHATADAGGSGLYKSNGGPLTTVADTSVQFNSFTPSAWINAGGTIAFTATTATGQGVYVSTDGSPVRILHAQSPPFTNFGSPVVSDSGVIAVGVAFLTGGNGIVTVDPAITDEDGNPIVSEVVRLGQPLFGSTLVSFGGFGLNSAGDLAFYYELQNGVNGIALASVPEPTAMSMFGAGILFALRRRRRI